MWVGFIMWVGLIMNGTLFLSISAVSSCLQMGVNVVRSKGGHNKRWSVMSCRCQNINSTKLW